VVSTRGAAPSPHQICQPHRPAQLQILWYATIDEPTTRDATLILTSFEHGRGQRSTSSEVAASGDRSSLRGTLSIDDLQSGNWRVRPDFRRHLGSLFRVAQPRRNAQPREEGSRSRSRPSGAGVTASQNRSIEMRGLRRLRPRLPRRRHSGPH